MRQFVEAVDVVGHCDAAAVSPLVGHLGGAAAVVFSTLLEEGCAFSRLQIYFNVEEMVFVVDPVMADELISGVRMTHMSESITITDGPRGRTQSVSVGTSGEFHSVTALMGGIIDGPGMLSDDKRPITVVKNGFLIAPPIQRTWWWWSRDRE